MGLGMECLLPSGRAYIVDVRAWERTVVDLLGGRAVGSAPIGFAGALKPGLLAWVEELAASLPTLRALRLTGGGLPEPEVFPHCLVATAMATRRTSAKTINSQRRVMDMPPHFPATPDVLCSAPTWLPSDARATA
jgi:hypothetical protein